MLNVSSATMTVAQLRVSTEPPKSGPGFDGLDADGDGGVNYDEFWEAAQSVRYGGVMTISASVAQTSIQSASLSGGGLLEDLSNADVGFDAAAEFERAMAAIGVVFTEDAEAGDAADAAPMDEETEVLRERALEAVDVLNYEVTREDIMAYTGGLSSFDPYERAAENIFDVADADGDGLINRSEFGAMRDALFGDGRTAGVSSITLTAVEGYATSLRLGLPRG